MNSCYFTEHELARGNKGAYSFILLVRVDKGWRERASCTMREKSAGVPRPRVARSLVGYMSMSATVGCLLVVPVKQARLLEWRGGSVTKSLAAKACVAILAIGAVSPPLSIPSS